MATSINTNIVLTLDGKQAEKMLSVLTKKSETLKEEIRDLRDKRVSIGLSGDEAKHLDAIQKEFRETRKAIRETATQIADVSSTINRISTAPIKEIERAIKAVTAQMKKLDRGTERYAERQKQLSLLRAELDRINNSGKKVVSVFDQIGATMKRLASYVLVYAGFNELTRGLRNLIEINAKLSDQMADIQKTTGIYGKELQELGESIRSIDTRTSVEDLNNLAYTAGKLGITGKENILEFVKAANQINVALGEDLGEDAIKNIAKLNDVLGITKQLGVERSLLATGSAINELGQSSTASEGYLVDFAQRLGGVAAQAGITIQQILALGSASDQMGQNVEVSATALNKVITTLLSHTDQVAKAIGATSQELRDALNVSTWEGLMFVFERLAGKGGLAAIAPLMKDLGSDGARLNAVISALSTNVGKMNDALAISNDAFAKATSLTAETMKKEESLMGIWDRAMKNLKNYFQDSAISNQLKDIAVYVYRVTGDFDELGNRIGGAVNILATFVQWLMKLGVFLAKNIDWMAAFAAGFVTIKTAAIGAQLATRAYSVVVASGVAITKAAHAANILFSAGLALLNGNLTRAAAAMKLFRAATLSNPFTLAATAIVTLGTAIYTVYRRATEASRQMYQFRKDLNQSIASEQTEAKYLFDVARRSAAGTDERRRAIDEINNKYKEYLPNLLTETSTTTDLSEALSKVNAALKDNIVMRMKQADTESALRTSLTSQLNALDRLRSASTNTDTMDQKIIDRANELIKTYSDMGTTATETFLTVQKALMDEFGESARQSGKYWSVMNDYVVENINQRDKLIAIDKKYAPFSPKEKKTNNVLPEVTVTAPAIPLGSLSEAEKKKAIQAQQQVIDIWLQQRKNALIEARLAQQDINSENYVSEEEYNRALESLEMQALQKRLAILGLEPAEIEKIRGQILEIRQKMLDDAVKIQQKFQQVLLNADPVKKEEKEYQDRLRAVGLFGVEREDMTADQLKVLESLESQHQENILDIQRKARTREKRQAEEAFKQRVEQKYGVSYENWTTERNQEESSRKNDLDLQKSMGTLSVDEEFAREQAFFEWKMKALQEELALRQEVGADTQQIFKEIASTEKEAITSAIEHAKNKFDTFKQVGETLGEAFGTVFEDVGEGFRNLGDALIDMAFDYLGQMAEMWLREIGMSAEKNVFEASANAIGKKGLLGLAEAALINAAIAGLLSVAKAGIKSALRGGDSSSSSGSTGQRVVKSSGFIVGGPTGDGDIHEVAGVVHRREYVVPAWQMKDPVSFDYVRALETIRMSRTPVNPLPRHGYLDGGGVRTTVPPINSSDPELNATLKGVQMLLQKLDKDGVSTVLSVSRLKETQDRISASVLRGSRKK